MRKMVGLFVTLKSAWGRDASVLAVKSSSTCRRATMERPRRARQDSISLSRAHKIFVEKKAKKGEPVQMRLDQPGKWSSQSVNTRDVTEDLAKAIALDKRPVSLVDGVGFSAWLSKYLPQYPMPAHITIAAKIDEIGGGFVAFLKKTVALAPAYALTTDGWTSDAGHFYCCQTIHFFRPESLRLYSFVLALGLCGRTADESAAFLVSVLARFSLMLENASLSRRTAVRCKLLQSDCVSCVCHWLNLCVRTVFFAGAPPSPGYPQGQAPSPVYDVIAGTLARLRTLP